MEETNYSLDIDLIPLNVVIYSYDANKDDFVFVAFNSSAEETENIKQEQLIGKYLLDVFPGAKEFGIFDLFKKAYETGEQQHHKKKYYYDNRISGWRENDIYKLDDKCIMAVYRDLGLEQSLENKLEMLGHIVNNSFNEIYLFEATDFKFTYLNLQAQKNIGYTLEEMKEMCPWDIKPLYTEESFKKSIFNGSEFNIIETVHKRKDSTEYQVEVKVQKMILNHKEYYVAIASDITQQYVYEERLLLSKEIIDSISEAVIITDIESNILDVNPAYLKLSGFAKEEIIGKSPKIFKSGKHDEEFYTDMWYKILNDGIYKGEIWDRKASGEIFLKSITITAVKDKYGNVKNYVGVFRDITDERNFQQELENMAFTDSLTKLTNRAQFKNILKREIAVASRTRSEGALLLIDLDMFKKVNDTLGHLIGDELLIAVALRLLEIMRKSDEVSRIGGDEFTIILSSPVKKDAVQYIAQNIIDTLEKPFLIEKHEIFISSSIGIAFFSEKKHDINKLIKSADLAMYKAKELGRGNYQFFQSEMNKSSTRKRIIENELRHALATGEIVPYYQPKINPIERSIVGVEALARWEHKEKGTLSPAYFLEIAEDSGLIHELGEQILLKSMREIKELNDTRFPKFTVAVNLSSKQFDDNMLIEKILLHIKNCQFNVHNLELEITESLIMHDVDRAIEMMKELALNNVRLSIDDFGTGYSSLSYLKNFPVSSLKIDKSFVDGITISKQDRAIVNTIITMAESLDLSVIAEGIEDVAQEEYLSSQSCLLCQGYLYSKPLSFKELKKFLITWNMKK